ncbi:conserved domain protein [Bacteroides fluxus YIT 12057]|uniref:Conserved domain protein n=1 Tax=Bacteroides fluxus YIT 12057 TaxID=763034 RepID=F3PQK6_9BACE|nr:conserved domain protein [Bacteroides fluxus YIT 12057]
MVDWNNCFSVFLFPFSSSYFPVSISFDILICYLSVIFIGQKWCKTLFFWKTWNFYLFLSIQYQMYFCKFGVNLIREGKSHTINIVI